LSYKHQIQDSFIAEAQSLVHIADPDQIKELTALLKDRNVDDLRNQVKTDIVKGNIQVLL
jgi:hypothetical protein